MSLTYEELSKLLTTQNELNQQQMISLAKTFEKTHSSIFSFNGANTIKFPTFSGGGKEDANDFTGQVDLTASLYKLSAFQKADILPLLLTGNARIWYTASPHLHAKSFDNISEALVTQFYNESDLQ